MKIKIKHSRLQDKFIDENETYVLYVGNTSFRISAKGDGLKISKLSTDQDDQLKIKPSASNMITIS